MLIKRKLIDDAAVDLSDSRKRRRPAVDVESHDRRPHAGARHRLIGVRRGILRSHTIVHVRRCRHIYALARHVDGVAAAGVRSHLPGPKRGAAFVGVHCKHRYPGCGCLPQPYKHANLIARRLHGTEGHAGALPSVARIAWLQLSEQRR